MSFEQQSQKASEKIHSGRVFSSLPMPEGVEALVIEASVGPLTAIHAPVAEGVKGKGTALFIPGFTGSKEDFYELFALLPQRGWDVWAYSQRGQGDSVAPSGIESYGRDQTASDALEVAAIITQATACDGIHLLGHSFGGLVAQATVIKDPSPFRSLTLMSSGPHGWPGRKADIRERLLNSGGVDLWRLDNPDKADWPDDRLDPLQRFLRERSERTSTDQLIGAIDQLANVHDTTFEVKDTGLPALVFHGIDDIYAWPQEWQHRMAILLGARYEIIPDAAHCPNGENPVPTADLLDDFWSKH
ncbi:alpha/beta fold hydrolase [Bifidobacterium psychraerophilum]|uniref:Alpha/beta hydrolase family protein n=1 Tax=Bifidobacterium psychraerophilum TaxID=218140 RepID=A0A087CHQ9_9BIFI|nr:alpha/beta hydrolase [Bifidobacterium psychraerophilum]KFI82809.1 alpha/beta hydrolase family protein [Bifidobacterium psychraerophilum]PKA94557.1 pimeloyl-ACP methyl ester carboxylesterase [Bifidobacterium psychraerophilum DSM 22366]